MLAPFVTDLLLACTFLLMAGWANEAIARWIGVSRRTSSATVPAPVGDRRTFDRDDYMVCGSCGLSGDWLFKLDHPERN
jgi:hypothetical protein